MATLVLTVIGNDRAGLVDALAGPIAAHGGSWERSHLARLAGQFAGIVVVTVPNDGAAALSASLDELSGGGLLDIRLAVVDAAPAADDSALVQLQLVGQDRPGIVHEISSALASRAVSIEELETSTMSAPMSAELLFEATAILRVPAGLPFAELRAALEEIANELMVDLDLEPA